MMNRNMDFNAWSQDAWLKGLQKELGEAQISSLNWDFAQGMSTHPYQPTQTQLNIKTFPKEFKIGAWLETGSNQEIMDALMGGAESLFFQEGKFQSSEMTGVLGDIIQFQFANENDLNIAKQGYDASGFPENNWFGAIYSEVSSTVVIPGGTTQDVVNQIRNVFQQLDGNCCQLVYHTSGSYFFDIAVLRFLRYVLEQHQSQPQIQVVAKGISDADAYNDLLRLSTQALAGVMGGANSIVLQPVKPEKSADAQRWA